jgi:hypothetical protein
MNRVYVDSKSGIVIMKADFVERDAENYKLSWGRRRRLIPIDKVLMIEDDGDDNGARPADRVEAPPSAQYQRQQPLPQQSPPLSPAFQQEVAKSLSGLVVAPQQADLSQHSTQVRIEWSGDATGWATIAVSNEEANNPEMSGELAKAVFAHPGVKSALTDYQVVNLQKVEGVVFLQVRKRAAPSAGDAKSMQSALSSLYQKLDMVQGASGSPSIGGSFMSPAKSAPSAFEHAHKLDTDSDDGNEE